MELLIILHQRLAYSVIFFMLIMGLWGLWSFVRGQAVSGGYMGALAVGEALIVVQALAGVLLYLSGARGGGAIHYLYGATAVIAIPSAFAYIRGQDSRRETLVYAMICFFVFGLALRGIQTA
jgi:hypothetical protein